MKRIIALICAVLMVLAVSGCDKEKKGEGYSVDIEYFVKTGQVKEADFALGTPIKDIEKHIEKNHTDDGTHCQGEISLVEEGDYNYYNSSEFYYYYNTDKEDKGISCIVAFNEIYGFSVGESGEYTVKSALEMEELDVTSEIADEDEFFFLPFAIEDCKKLTCSVGNNVLVFYFENDALIAGVIYNTENWTA